MTAAGCITMNWGWCDTQVKVDINKAAGLREITQAADEALTLYRDDMIEDENEMVPVSGGASRNGGGGSLQQSAFEHSDKSAKDGKITIRWDKPYAHYQHEGLVMHGPVGARDYGPKHLNYTSATARAEWTKHAEKVYGDNWAKGLQRLIGGR